MVGRPGMENTYFNFYFLIAYVPKIFCFKNSPCLLVYQLDSFSVGQFLSWTVSQLVAISLEQVWSQPDQLAGSHLSAPE